MKHLSNQLVIYLIECASVFVMMFGIHSSVSRISLILLAAVITITLVHLSSTLTNRAIPDWLERIAGILLVRLVLGVVIIVEFFSAPKLTISVSHLLANITIIPGREPEDMIKRVDHKVFMSLHFI
jgi:hypothetical protein